MKGRLDVAGVSRGGSFEIHAQAPNKMFLVMQAHPLGTLKVGYNGRHAWEQDGRGTRLSKGAELEALAREADFYDPVNLRQHFKKVTLLGKSKIGYREVYVLELQPRLGKPEKLFLNAETYLPVRMNTVRMVGVITPGRAIGQGGRASAGRASEADATGRSSGAGASGSSTGQRANGSNVVQIAVPVEIYFDDWRAVDGIKYPFRISQSGANITLGFTITEIRHNVAVDASLFEMPRK